MGRWLVDRRSRACAIASGKSWDPLFKDERVGPLSMPDTDDATASHAPPTLNAPNPRIAGGARTRLLDSVHVTQMIVRHGMWNGVAYLDPDGVAAKQHDRPHRAQHAVVLAADPIFADSSVQGAP